PYRPRFRSGCPDGRTRGVGPHVGVAPVDVEPRGEDESRRRGGAVRRSRSAAGLVLVRTAAPGVVHRDPRRCRLVGASLPSAAPDHVEGRGVLRARGRRQPPGGGGAVEDRTTSSVISSMRVDSGCSPRASAMSIWAARPALSGSGWSTGVGGGVSHWVIGRLSYPT